MTEPYQPYPPNQPVPPQQPQPVPAVPPPTEQPVQGFITGVAAGVQTRVEGSNQNARGMTVLNFRLHPADRDQPIEVEMRSYSLTGSIRDGDQVAMPATVSRSGQLEPRELQNMTTGTVVKATGATTGRKAAAIVVAVIMVVLLALVVGIALTMS